jgi:putative Holliday junction resolvase
VLVQLLVNLEPAEILVGIPLNMDGSEGEMAAEARRFGEQIGSRLSVLVTERDERLSSVEADRRLRESSLPRGKRREKGRRDMLAATVLLEDYLAES